jgi:type IV pilus assembly protein PilV
LIRSQATQAGADILDRMRANRTVALAGGYDMTDVQNPGSSGATGLALTDLGEWMTGLQGNLPAGDGSVLVAGNIATVTITWSDVLDNNTITVVSRL